MTTTPIAWPEAQRICDIPEVRELIDAFAGDSHEENMLAMVSAFMGHASAQGRAAALEEAAKVLTKRIQDRYQSHQRTDGETGERYFDNDYAEQMEAAYHAELGALAEVIKLKTTASPTSSDAGKDDALELDAKRLDFLTDYQVCIVRSRDGDVFSAWHRDEDGEWEPLLGYPLKCFDSPREAIDVAIAAQGEGK